MNMSSLYEVLGIRPGAHPVEIDAAYQLLKELPGLDAEDQIGISVAYQTLIYPSRRAEYDRDLIKTLTIVQPPVAQLQHPIIINKTPVYLPEPKRSESASVAVWFVGGVVGMCLLFVIGLAI
jgi:hypothetical protein